MVAMSALPPPLTDDSAHADGADATPATVILQVLAAIGTGIGVLGFVILCGGAVTFIRLDAVGLPAAEGVAQVPREVLVTTGAELLVPAALAAIAAVAILYFTLMALRAVEAWRLRPHITGEATALAEVATSRETLERREAESERARRQALAAGECVNSLTADPATLEEARTAAIRRRDEADNAFTEARSNVTAASEALAASEAKATTAGEKVRSVRGIGRLLSFCVGALVLTLCSIWLAASFGTSIDAESLAKVFGIGALLSALAFAVFASTGKFGWFGIVAFVTIGVVYCSSKLFAIDAVPRVVPAAVLQRDRQPLAGFLVAKTSGELLLAHPMSATSTSQAPSLAVIPASEVTDLWLGDVTTATNAPREALVLLAATCALRTRDGAPVASPPTSTASTGSATGAAATISTAQVQRTKTLCSEAEQRLIRRQLVDLGA